MDLGIRGRRAIVAGASAGLGKSAAKALAREGVDLVISARGEERLRATANEIRAETGAKVVPVAADHGLREGRAALLAACPAPDILVITCSPPKFTDDYRLIEEADWIDTLRPTLIGPIELIRMAVGGMAERGWGRVVNIGTLAAKFPVEDRLLSGVPRAGLVNYSVAVSKRLAQRNVIINNLLPGMFHTRAMHERFTRKAEENATNYDIETQKIVDRWAIPVGRFGEPEELGELCAMFCSNHISYTVGQSLVVDGGILNSVV